MSLAAMERFLIEQALARRNGNRQEAARDLGIDVSTLYRKTRSLGLAAPERDGRGTAQTVVQTARVSGPQPFCTGQS